MIQYENIFKPPMMSLFVISACNLQCPECIMMNQMNLHASYQMSIEEIEKLIYYSERSGYCFNYRYTGGEPLYWKHLKEGTRLLRNSKSCKSILLMTNAMKYENLTEEIVEMLDYIRISQYTYNEQAMKIVKNKYHNKTRIVDREEFYPNPNSPFENATPVECGNLEHLYFQGKIYACPHSYSLALKHNLTHLELGEEIKDNFLNRNCEIREGHIEICKLCLGNKKVRDQIDKTKNISPYHEKLLVQLTKKINPVKTMKLI